MSTNGNSLIDYVLVPEELFPFINNFTVHDMHSFSPHLPISVELKLDYILLHRRRQIPLITLENSRSHECVHHMQPETPKLDTIVNNIVGNNVEINIGIDHSSHILYKGKFAVFGGKQLSIIIIKKKGSMTVPGLIASVNMQGFHSGVELESLHLKFLKHLLGVNQSTASRAVDGEFACLPIYVMR